MFCVTGIVIAGTTLYLARSPHAPASHTAANALPKPKLPIEFLGPSMAEFVQHAPTIPADPEDSPVQRAVRRPEIIQLAEIQGDRVPVARARVEGTLRNLFASAGLSYPPTRLFIRAFKREREMELWSAPELGGYRLVATYQIAGTSGGPGPKRREGDGQTPEGFYQIDRYNPKSNFHLSMGLNYPNGSDRILSDPVKPGYDIFIHGRASSIGCMAVGDDRVEELFIAAVDALERPVPVHVFPARMNSEDWESWRDEHAAGRPELLAFWENLAEGFEIFEQRRVLPTVTVLADGRYQFACPTHSLAQDLRQ